MLSYKADCEAEVTPNIMTRFREEVYAARWYKAFARRERDSKSAPAVDPWASRAQYLQKPLSVRKAIAKAQKAQGRLDGF